MKFLVDNALSPRVAELLQEAGLEPELDRGAIVALYDTRLRIRRLPIGWD